MTPGFLLCVCCSRILCLVLLLVRVLELAIESESVHGAFHVNDLWAVNPLHASNGEENVS